MGSDISVNSFKIRKKDTSPDYLWDKYYFWQFLYYLSILVFCKKYVFDIFNSLGPTVARLPALEELIFVSIILLILN